MRISPQKARLVIDLIRGQQAGKAITILQGTNKRIAPSVEKVLNRTTWTSTSSWSPKRT
jgi:large subunit ribosomal protein L22